MRFRETDRQFWSIPWFNLVLFIRRGELREVSTDSNGNVEVGIDTYLRNLEEIQVSGRLISRFTAIYHGANGIDIESEDYFEVSDREMGNGSRIQRQMILVDLEK